MNAFVSNSTFEEQFSADLRDVIGPVLAPKGQSINRIGWLAGFQAPYQLDRDMQKTAGDFFITDDKTGKIVANADLKVERRTSTNLFFETASNANAHPGMYNPGWGYTVKARSIWYAFADTGLLASINLHRLRDWLNETVQTGSRSPKPRLLQLPEVVQCAHEQRNVTTGRLIAFSALPPEILQNAYNLDFAQKVCRELSRDEFLASLQAAAPARA